MPAILIETGRMTNKEDMDILASAQNRQDMAQAIGRGMIRYFAKKDKIPANYHCGATSPTPP